MRGYSFDPDSGVWLHESRDRFAYSDGEALERKMLRILLDTSDLSSFSPLLRSQIVNWPTTYHFSPQRHNLLRHLHFKPQQSILELGAGCGAITRQLGESGADLIAIEGSPTRAACAAARVRDLKNVRVASGNFQQFQTDERFDVITLIGVLEYAPIYFKTEQPLLACLRLAKSLLKQDGVLILAIENQLGLKYFCGAPEDHTSRPFDGIQDFYKKDGQRTLGRAELTRLLVESGFPDLKFQYPFPDYKLPKWIFTKRAFQTADFDPAAILAGIEPQHDGKPAKLPADERRIWPVLQSNGLIPDLANSFLILAGDASKLIDNDLLAAGYALERRDCFNTQTRITADQSGKILVHKSRLSSQQPPPGIEIEFAPSDEPYQPGVLLESKICSDLHSTGLSAAMDGLLLWMNFVVQNGLSVKNPRDIYDSILKPEFFDCHPRNLIIAGDSLVQIDIEWRYTGNYSLRNHALRYLSLLARREESALRSVLGGKTPLAEDLARRLGIGITKAQFADYRHWQHTLNQWIVGKKDRKKRGFLKKLLG
jgi:hypothetical protein